MFVHMPALVPLWWLAVVQILGLGSAWLVRVNQGSRHAWSCQWAFLLLLSAVGGTTILLALTMPNYCLVSGATFAVMVLGAVWDFDGGRSAGLATTSRR